MTVRGKPRRRSRPAVRIRLFVAGQTANSLSARQALDELLAMPELAVKIETTIVDVLSEPREALRFGLVATPTLLLEVNGKSVRFIGDLNRPEQLVQFLRGAVR